ncbi:expressed protein [Echinococcus multilocularis]|uniref:Expressed protein n=1 Tax=Echinococcus multilocularis TaxID=6211 RepID=A0A068Y182_ECHMU|nr:expressed protein [Echinococcus multilocularis]
MFEPNDRPFFLSFGVVQTTAAVVVEGLVTHASRRAMIVVAVTTMRQLCHNSRHICADVMTGSWSLPHNLLCKHRQSRLASTTVTAIHTTGHIAALLQTAKHMASHIASQARTATYTAPYTEARTPARMAMHTDSHIANRACSHSQLPTSTHTGLANS